MITCLNEIKLKIDNFISYYDSKNNYLNNKMKDLLLSSNNPYDINQPKYLFSRNNCILCGTTKKLKYCNNCNNLICINDLYLKKYIYECYQCHKHKIKRRIDDLFLEEIKNHQISLNTKYLIYLYNAKYIENCFNNIKELEYKYNNTKIISRNNKINKEKYIKELKDNLSDIIKKIDYYKKNETKLLENYNKYKEEYNNISALSDKLIFGIKKNNTYTTIKTDELLDIKNHIKNKISEIKNNFFK